MVFSTLFFLTVFLPAVLGACWLSSCLLAWRARKNHAEMSWRPVNAILLLASLFFYFWGEGLGVGWLCLSVVANDWLARIIHSRHEERSRKIALVLLVAANLCFLGWFKYAGFLAQSVNSLLHLGVPVPHVLLPLGISFYTFQAMSYGIDVYRRETKPADSIIDFACYVTMFLQLVAGPIVRYADIETTLRNRIVSLDAISSGWSRFLFGLGKKVLIANTVASMADGIWSLADRGLGMPPLLTALGILCYSLQIYYDFSGYSDMAIGLGRMLGFSFPENFLHPYCSASVREFWRRWHISLSTWFRDYLYIPLGGNRKGKLRAGINGLVVFALCGLWHGAGIMFVVWGLWHGLFLLLEKAFASRTQKTVSLAASIPRFLIGHVYTIFVFMAGWIFFRSESTLAFATIWKSLLGLLPVSPDSRVLWLDCTFRLQLALFAGVILSYPIIPALQRIAVRFCGANAALLVKSILATIVGLFSILFLIGNSYNPFLYFRF